MIQFSYKPICNQDETGSSAFVMDLRNSTKLTREISWDDKLLKHIDFMMNLHECVYSSLYEKCDPDSFAINDTGDGYLCVFWDKKHALTCLRQAIYMRDYLEKNLPIHNDALEIQDSRVKLDFAFGLHSGGSTINRSVYHSNNGCIRKDFMFGIVVNTASRLESFTKNYIGCNFVVTGNYRGAFLEQAPSPILKSLFTDNSAYVRESLGRVNLNDGKEEGHTIYALTDKFINIFLNADVISE